MKERFLEKLYGEYQAYKASTLSCPNAEIFSRYYEIEGIMKKQGGDVADGKQY